MTSHSGDAVVSSSLGAYFPQINSRIAVYRKFRLIKLSRISPPQNEPAVILLRGNGWYAVRLEDEGDLVCYTPLQVLGFLIPAIFFDLFPT